MEFSELTITKAWMGDRNNGHPYRTKVSKFTLLIPSYFFGQLPKDSVKFHYQNWNHLFDLCVKVSHFFYCSKEVFIKDPFFVSLYYVLIRYWERGLSLWPLLSLSHILETIVRGNLHYWHCFFRKKKSIFSRVIILHEPCTGLPQQKKIYVTAIKHRDRYLIFLWFFCFCCIHNNLTWQIGGRKQPLRTRYRFSWQKWMLCASN